MGKVNKIISCDPSEGGRDKTVIMWGGECNGVHKVCLIESEDKSDPMSVADRIVSLYRSKGADYIKVDCIGIGSGVVSRLKQVLKSEKVKVIACHFGEGAEEGKGWEKGSSTSNRKRFLNKKAEQYFRLAGLFEEGLIDVPNHPVLKKELMGMKKERSMSEKWKVIDPEEKSPDFSDCLVYFCWKVKSSGGFFVINS
jgi:hypothetical protein